MATLRSINIIVRIVPPAAGEARTGTGHGTSKVGTIREVKAPEDLKVRAVHQAVTNSRTDMAGIRTRGAAIKAEGERRNLPGADRWETGNRPVRRDRPGLKAKAAERIAAGSTAVGSATADRIVADRRAR